MWKARRARSRVPGRSRRGRIRQTAAWTAAALLGLVVVAGIVAAAVGIGRWWSRWEMPSPPVQTIYLRGLQRLSAEEIRALLPFREGDRLFGLPLQAATRRLAGHPWVARASLHRSLSGDVVVAIEERQPVAVLRDGESAWYVDQRGALLGPAGERPGPRDLTISGVSVARLRAGAPDERKRLQEGLALLAMARRDGVDVAEAAVRRDDEVVLLFGAWRLHFRFGQYEEPWRRFWQVAERIPADGRRPQDVDLRFANSVVVKSEKNGSGVNKEKAG
ncbi:MAG: FtsQ-type POTRA domain-containing protein [Nitrospirota bacterium]